MGECWAMRIWFDRGQTLFVAGACESWPRRESWLAVYVLIQVSKLFIREYIASTILLFNGEGVMFVGV